MGRHSFIRLAESAEREIEILFMTFRHVKAGILTLFIALLLATGPPLPAQDTTPPTASYDPPPDTTVPALTLISVTFSEAVTGVNASDLLINGQAATTVVTNEPNDYTFHFPQPPTGTVQVTWASNHGITDVSPQANPFAGGSWTYTLDTNLVANVVISEFLAVNNGGIRDDDGVRSDWIELLSTGSVQASLDGWFLTDAPTNLTKWRFPAGMPPLQPNSYLLLFASGKNRTNPLAPLHTNFKLASEAGNYLALVDPRTNVVSAFNLYPAQQPDVSYGRDAVNPNLVGLLRGVEVEGRDDKIGRAHV